MSYPKQQLRLRPTRGLALDIPANEVGPDFYTGGTNVLFRDGFVQRIPGSRGAYTQNTVDPVLHVLNVRAPGGVTESNFWLAFGTSEIQALETSNIDDVTGSALTPVSAAWQWTTTLLNNIPCFTNGLDAPRYWGGDIGTPATALPGWPAGTICKSIIAFKFHLFAFDIDGPAGHFESQIMWSDAAAPGSVPGTWTAAATNEAGDAILADTPGPCMCGVLLQDTLLVFKRSSTYGINYVGGNEVFAVRLLDGDRGALTRHSAIDVGGQVFLVTDGDVVLTDGTNWNSIAFGTVRDHLFSQLDQASYENLFLIHDRAHAEVWICYPTTGNVFCDEAIIYNLLSGAWGIESLVEVACGDVGVVNDLAVDESWDADSGTWDSDASAWNSANFSLATEQLLLGSNSSVLTLTDDATPVSVNASIAKHDLTFGDASRFKFIKRVHIRASEDAGELLVRVGARNSVTDSISWGAEQSLVAPASFVNVLAMGKYLSLEVRSVGSNVWQLTGLDLEYELRGYV